jgi:hypothetical protein
MAAFKIPPGPPLEKGGESNPPQADWLLVIGNSEESAFFD